MDLNRTRESATKRILVCDDAPDNLFLLQYILESEGYTTILADSGTAALEMMAENPPDLAVLDLMMPDMNGLEVVQQMRQNYHTNIPVILLTACRDDIPKQATSLVDAIVHKPFNCDQLLGQLKDFLCINY